MTKLMAADLSSQHPSDLTFSISSIVLGVFLDHQIELE